MKEEDAKKKMCVEIFKAVVIAKSAGSKISIEEIEKFSTCKGSVCMSWHKKDISETSESEAKPDGDDWQEADAVELPVRWFRWVAGGDCGLKRAKFRKVGDIEISE